MTAKSQVSIALRIGLLLFSQIAICMAGFAQAQPSTVPSDRAQSAASENEEAPNAPSVVEVQPVTKDEQIVKRLEHILQATGWFQNPQVKVDEGVVFLRGRTGNEQYKEWAGSMAGKTRDVVAVVNQIELAQPSPWNFQPALEGLRDLWRNVLYWCPYVALAMLILLIAFGAAIVVSRGLRSILTPRIRVSLLREVIARSVAILVFLLGLYIVLRICGLTRLALTVVGGTGLFGLVIGIAFRDITENFLASILLSLQAPFRTGDLVELAGVLGFVQQLNVRTTVLTSPAGNNIQLPNAVVYKSTIRNYSTNPNRREDFTVGISYDTPIPHAQEIAMRVLEQHSAVLKHPEPSVLVDSLGPSAVNLRVYFWLDGSQYSWLKVKSSVIRLVKRAFQDQGIPIPDEGREVIFPHGVPVQMMQESKSDSEKQKAASSRPQPATEAVSSEAEGGLDTEAKEIKEQASQAHPPAEGENLLPSAE